MLFRSKGVNCCRLRIEIKEKRAKEGGGEGRRRISYLSDRACVSEAEPQHDSESSDNADPIDWMTAWQCMASLYPCPPNLQVGNKDSDSSFGHLGPLLLSLTEHPEEPFLPSTASTLCASILSRSFLSRGKWACSCSTQIAAPGAVDEALAIIPPFCPFPLACSSTTVDEKNAAAFR